MRNYESKVFAMLPRAGLANRLLVWAKAAVFADINHLPLYVHGWNHIHLGPIIRREKSARYYGSFFENPKNASFHFFVNRLLHQERLQYEPTIEVVDTRIKNSFVFSVVPHKSDYFKALRGHEDFLRACFFDMIRKKWRDRSPAHTEPFIALHVRRGDFINAGFTLASEKYFVDTLTRVRQASGIEQAFVFSDATPEQLPLLSKSKHVEFCDLGNEILDLQMMAQSAVLLTSLQSTFGYWAGFVSDAAIILDPRHNFGRIRSHREGLFEGDIDQFEKIKGASC